MKAIDRIKITDHLTRRRAYVEFCLKGQHWSCEAESEIVGRSQPVKHRAVIIKYDSASKMHGVTINQPDAPDAVLKVLEACVTKASWNEHETTVAYAAYDNAIERFRDAFYGDEFY